MHSIKNSYDSRYLLKYFFQIDSSILDCFIIHIYSKLQKIIARYILPWHQTMKLFDVFRRNSSDL